jgi:sialic acid synthase SpsE
MTNLTSENFSTQLESIALTYATDTILILGKGQSADDVSPDIFKHSLVIGINDAERIAPVDITLFHAPWVVQGLARSGFRSSLYVASQPLEAKGKPVFVAPFLRATQSSADLLMQRFMSDDFMLEEVLFLSALHIAKQVAKLRGHKQTVYMIGFDFDPKAPYSKALDIDYSPTSSSKKSLSILPQEHYFLHALYLLTNSLLEVKHVGLRSFSALNSLELNSLLAPHVAPFAEHFESRVSIVAELTTNHFGDRVRLERMIRASKAAGANYVKLQKRDVETFYSAKQLSSVYVSPFGNTFADYRNQLELSTEDFWFVDALCKDLGISWFASVLDQPSFEYMLQFQPELIKLPSTISEHTDYLAFVAEHFLGSVVLSTGMTGFDYEQFVLEQFKNCKQLYLLQCNSAYPTPNEDCNVAVVRHYHELSLSNPRIVPGYSSHDFGWKASALAVAAGARMLEKHVKLGTTEWAHFDAVAVDLTTSAFAEYVREIRETELMLGSDSKKVNRSEHHKYFRTAN